MAVGEAFTGRQLRRVEGATSAATRQTGVEFSVFVGDLATDPGDTAWFRARAEQMHSRLGVRAASGLLLVVAPGQRQLEIVTGSLARRRIPDRACVLASLSMTTAFAGGDLVGGLVTGLRMLADAAARVPG